MDSIRSLGTFIKTRPLISTGGALILGVAVLAYHDYRAYVALGPHGLPDNFWGWWTQLKMSLKARNDTTVPAPYDLEVVAGPHDRTSFLPQTQSASLSWRPGNKAPQVPGFVAPQRQTTQQASASRKEAMFGYLDALVAANSQLLQTHLSVLEGPVPALGMRGFGDMAGGAGPRALELTKGEMCHIHPLDGSTHLILSLADQKRVIELGWGRRHRLSGGGLLPFNYTFIYAPRDEAEMAVWKSIVIAGARFCCADVSEIRAPDDGGAD